ncbi:hypothetical protein EVAR_69125_1 [Eumeta japonica]|uniref:Uncharacterized protein n=1 Tax=Eumeta variegata TaxID=151549 RepID=A0A4C1SC15_EUMVA|nr:hypothetical protein EVAR_69125_1 [Eumeta japonica]
MRRKGVIIKKLLLGAIFSIWRRERQPYEVAKLKFGKSISKSIKLPIFKTPGKLSSLPSALRIRSCQSPRRRGPTLSRTGLRTVYRKKKPDKIHHCFLSQERKTLVKPNDRFSLLTGVLMPRRWGRVANK